MAPLSIPSSEDVIGLSETFISIFLSNFRWRKGKANWCAEKPMFSCDGWVEGFHLVRSSTLSDQSCTLHSRPLDEYWYLHVRWGNALFHVRCHVDSPGLFSIKVLEQTRLMSFLFKGRTKHRKKSNDETLTISMPNWVYGLFKWIELRHQQPKETQLVHYPLTWKQITVVFGSATEGYAACVSINKRGIPC